MHSDDLEALFRFLVRNHDLSIFIGIVKLILKPYQDSISMVLGNPIKLLYSYDTYQFTDYGKYESSMFSEKAKVKHRVEQFPIDCQKSFDMGVNLAINV